MLTTAGDIVNDFLVKMNVSTTVAFYSDSALYTWLNEAHFNAAGAYKWPMTENRDTSLTMATGTETYTLPSGFKTDSVRILTVTSGGVENLLDKTVFEDYRKFRELNNAAGDRIWSDWIRTIYINPNLDISGLITLYGQKNPAAIDRTVADASNTTIFSNGEEEGNEAITYLMMSYAMMKEKKLDQAIALKQLAQQILDAIWKRIKDEQYAYKPKDSSMFKRFDVLSGRPLQEFPNTQDLSNRWF